MEMDKSQDRLLFAAHKPTNKKPASLNSTEQTRTDALLEELAEIIESEGGGLDSLRRIVAALMRN